MMYATTLLLPNLSERAVPSCQTHEQMKSSLQRLEARQATLTATVTGGDAPEVAVVVVGDFNSGASETVYRLLVE